jgi:hypothetical protein
MAGDISTTTPEFLFIEEEPDTEDIRNLLRELQLVGVTERTGKMFAGLSVLPPAMRLSLNLSKLSDILTDHEVSNVLEDGLLLSERSALFELDVQGLTVKSRTTARAMLNVKERWIMVKTLSGLFKSCRDTEGGFIPLDT